MKAILKNYRFPIILLSSVIIGSILGISMGTQAEVIKPLGDIFLNLMFTLVVPLVFFATTSAIANMGSGQRFKKSHVIYIYSFFRDRSNCSLSDGWSSKNVPRCNRYER